MSAARRLRFEQRGAPVWGAAWGVGFGLIEVVTVSPLQEGDLLEHIVWWLFIWLMPYWCVVGFVLVRLADRRARMGGLPGFLAAFLVVSLVSAAAQPLLSIGLLMLTRSVLPQIDTYARHAFTVAATLETWSNISLYNVWMTLFYGGLLTAARIFTARAEHIRSLLYSNAMARNRTAALLDAERLETLQAQIDPGLLLESMQELEQRYRIAPQRAERLLEALVDFLRIAMQGLRGSASSVDAELRLARAFAQLQRERGVRGAWRIVESAPREANQAATPSRKFPSLLMLPLLALGGGNGRPLLRARADKDRTVISLHGLAAQIPAELRQQIWARLHMLYGDAFRMESGESVGSALTITLHEPATSEGDPLEPSTA